MNENNEMVQTSQIEKISCQEVSSTSLQENNSRSWPNNLKKPTGLRRPFGLLEGSQKLDSGVNGGP